jgi:hypothetical protein
VRVSLPRSADLEIAADTGTGSIKSDFALGQRHDSWWSRLKPPGSLGSSIRGVIGHGGRALLMSTTAGNITIVADPD